MKLVLQIVALTIVVAGIGATSVASHATPSSQAVSATMPAPVCTPGIPTCPKSIGK